MIWSGKVRCQAVHHLFIHLPTMVEACQVCGSNGRGTAQWCSAWCWCQPMGACTVMLCLLLVVPATWGLYGNSLPSANATHHPTFDLSFHKSCDNILWSAAPKTAQTLLRYVIWSWIPANMPFQPLTFLHYSKVDWMAWLGSLFSNLKLPCQLLSILLLLHIFSTNTVMMSWVMKSLCLLVFQV